eukprot:TRINITY_DN5224_c0_g1_i5.p2 TRINITY_DN5224_c0_g1~~TRINITY_DN5224_c0_g1_i5.p2  ORF type:complete len:125 (-),score=32.51 TRINITY_DN5224_c0_g1_i5:121-495(-)
MCIRDRVSTQSTWEILLIIKIYKAHKRKQQTKCEDRIFKIVSKQRSVEIMKNKPDDRSDNVEKIQYNIDKTILNCELADEMIAKTEDEKMKQTLKEKNQRRENALNAMKKEIKDEALDLSLIHI